MLHIAKPTRRAYIEDLSQNPGEQEVLLPAGLGYNVGGKRTVGNLRIIALEIVDE